MYRVHDHGHVQPVSCNAQSRIAKVESTELGSRNRKLWRTAVHVLGPRQVLRIAWPRGDGHFQQPCQNWVSRLSLMFLFSLWQHSRLQWSGATSQQPPLGDSTPESPCIDCARGPSSAHGGRPDYPHTVAQARQLLQRRSVHIGCCVSQYPRVTSSRIRSMARMLGAESRQHPDCPHCANAVHGEGDEVLMFIASPMHI